MRRSIHRWHPFAAIRAAGHPEHVVRRLLILYWAAVFGTAMSAAYAVVNVINEAPLFLIQNVLLTVLFLLVVLLARAGNSLMALDLGFLPAILVIVAFQVLGIIRHDITVSRALYMPLTFVLLNQLAAFFALRVRHIVIPVAVSAGAGLFVLFTLRDELTANLSEASGVLLAYFLLLATTIITYRQTRRADAEIALREDLNREIHHRVKNEATMLLGLMDVEMESTESAETIEALKRQRQRIAAVLGTHRHLISPAEHRRVSLESYVTGLVKPLAGELHHHGRPPRITCSVEDADVHGSSAVPVGLILNELLTNALKHSEPDEECDVSVSIWRSGPVGLELTVTNVVPTVQRADLDSDGFGLGFVRRLAGSMGGSVLVEDNEAFSVSVLLPRVLEVNP